MKDEYCFGYRSDKGAVRPSNQDSLTLKMAESGGGEKIVMAVICDGMGGLSMGEKASAAVIKRLSQWFAARLPEILDQGGDAVKNSLNDVLQDTNRRFRDFGQANGVDMGTTVALLLLRDGKYLACNVGDSRIYRIIDTGCERLTHDHSLVARLVSQGVLTPEQAENDQRKNILTQAISTKGNMTPEFYEGSVRPGTVFLLCSDGFYHTLPDTELWKRFSPCGDSKALQAEAENCIHDAMERGETDNLSCLLIKTPKAEGRP